MSCSPSDCNNVAVLGDDGGSNLNLDENGFVNLLQGQVEVAVNFTVPKVNGGYRFEYLYVDAFGKINPGAINPVVISQTQFGFIVDLAAAPPEAGYVLRWRVVVIDLSAGTTVDAPEVLYIQLNHTIGDEATVPVQNIFFLNPRSTITYGFTELLVENLTDDPLDQYPVHTHVVEKRLDGFKIAINPVPD